MFPNPLFFITDWSLIRMTINALRDFNLCTTAIPPPQLYPPGQLGRIKYLKGHEDPELAFWLMKTTKMAT